MFEARRMTRATRLSLGAITLLPLVVTLWWLVETLVSPGVGLVAAFGVQAGAVLTLMLPLMILSVLLLYFPALLSNASIPREERWLWGVGFVLVGVFVVPVYWWKHVWREPYEVGDAGGGLGSRPGTRAA